MGEDTTCHDSAAAPLPSTPQSASTAGDAAVGPMDIPATRIAQLQKVCDVYDIFDPAVDYIIRNYLRTIPAVGRRTWEFAMIFLALHQAGKLNRSARALAMGAGTERLIFSIAELVGEAVITDLYLPDEGWKGVRTNDPQKLIMDAAPWPIPQGRIKAIPMDMRELKFHDNSFDFAWSTGAIEHIGGDEAFQRHFSEVHRVLKPGGVYAFTTVVTFGKDSERMPHNHYFHPEHLMGLADRSPLHPNLVFDCTVRDHYYNRPLTERSQDFGFRAANLLIHPFISFRRGVITAANLVVLTKKIGEKKKTRIHGFEDSAARLKREAQAFTGRVWEMPQNIAVEKARKSEAATTQWQYFGEGDFTYEVGLIGANTEHLIVSLRSRTVAYPVDKRAEATVDLKGDSGTRLTFAAHPDRLYRVTVQGASDISRIIIRAGKSDAFASAAVGEDTEDDDKE